MEKELINSLQPMFCTRASLLQAQDKLTGNPEVDCQMRLRFANGAELALNLTRDEIERMISSSLNAVETNIEAKLGLTYNKINR